MTGPVPTYEITHEPAVGHDRRRTLLAVAVVVLLLAVVGLVVVLVLTGRPSGSPPGAQPTPTTSASATPTPTPTPTLTPAPTPAPIPPSDPAAEGAVRRLGAVLEASRWGRGEVAAVMGAVTSGCTLMPDQAWTRLDGVVANRESALGQVSALPLTGVPEVDEATATLQAALNYSLQADRGYQRWVSETYQQYFYEHTIWPDDPVATPVTTCPGPAPSSEVLEDAGRLSGLSQHAKEAFVVVYNPLASRYGLPTWSASDF
jgi:hypothetical protein